MSRLLFRLVLVALALTAPGHVRGQTTRAITTDDYLDFRFVGDPTLAPDGSLVAYPVTRIDRQANRRISTIWIAPTDGSSPPRAVTAPNLPSSNPVWRPDGAAVAFYSSRPTPGDEASTRSQLHLLSLSGGEPRRITSLPNGVSGCSFAPDGARLVCLSRIGPSDHRVGPTLSDARHYTGLQYKSNDAGWFDDRRSHLWIIDAESGAARQLTSGDDWNDTDPRWSPDGNTIAFVSNRTGKEDNGDDNTDIWTVPAAGGQLTRISDHPFQDNAPRWSPDGRSIAYLGRENDADPIGIWLAPATGGKPTLLLAGDQVAPQGVEWAEQGAALVFTAETRGEAHAFRFDVASRQVSALTAGPRVVRSLSVASSGPIAYLASDFSHLDELYLADASGRNERRLSTTNDALLATLDLVPVERMTYEGADGLPIDGFLARPRGWEPGKSYPMILSIHGGPAGMYGVGWFHEFQAYAARGWAVFFVNPRGSTGYGHRFQRAIANEWGGKDYVDIMRGVDAVLAANAWIDPARLGVTGGSYGGS